MANGISDESLAQLQAQGLYSPAPAPLAPPPAIAAPPPMPPPAIAAPPPAPPIDTQAMVNQAINAPTFDYQQDRQARFDALKQEEAKKFRVDVLPGTGEKVIVPVLPLPLDQLSYPGKSLDEVAEDSAMERLLQEDQEIDAFQAQTRAAEEAQKTAAQERSLKAAQLGISLPTEEVKAIDQVLQKPSEPEIAQKEMQIRDELATQVAQKRTADRAIAQEQEKEKQVQQQAQEKVAEQELSISEKMQKGTFGQKLGIAIAILAGGLSQGLMGRGTNPVTDFMAQDFEQVMSRRKMRADEKAAAEAAFWKSKEFDLALDDAKRKKRLTDAQIGEINAKRIENADKATLELMRILKMKAGIVKDPSELNAKDLDRAVRVPDGTYRLAVNKKQAQELEKYRAEVEPALAGLQRVQELTKSGMPVDPRLREQVNAELQAIVGSLRLPITGPGVLTDSEREMLGEIIGNPNKIFGLNIIEQRKLQTITNKLDTDLGKRYFNAGINLPKNTKQQRIDKFLRDNPGVSKDKAEQIYFQTYGE